MIILNSVLHGSPLLSLQSGAENMSKTTDLIEVDFKVRMAQVAFSTPTMVHISDETMLYWRIYAPTTKFDLHKLYYSISSSVITMVLEKNILDLFVHKMQNIRCH